jgi:hypothetical protein
VKFVKNLVKTASIFRKFGTFVSSRKSLSKKGVFQGTLSRLFLGVQVDGDDQAIKCQDFREDQNQDHANEETWLLSSSSNTRIADDSYCETSSETRDASRKASAEIKETSENEV